MAIFHYKKQQLLVKFITLSSLLIFSACSLSPHTEQTSTKKAQLKIMSFEQCVRAGSPILRSHPPKCITPDGIMFLKGQNLGTLEESNCKDLCGNGVCEKVVCMGTGCPCPESKTTCPEDCK